MLGIEVPFLTGSQKPGMVAAIPKLCNQRLKVPPMPNTRQPKLNRRQQGAISLAGGLTREEFFNDLSEAYRATKDPDKKVNLGLQLLPYLVPRLRAVEVTQTQDVKVSVTVGGTDEAAASPVPASVPAALGVVARPSRA